MPTTKKAFPSIEIIIPAGLQKALAENAVAKNTFDAFSKSCKKEYIEWINSAKKNETRNNRIAKTIVMCSERN